MNILLVEDDRQLSSVLVETLTDFHYRVNRANDGEMGLELARTNQYDLILLDIIMPKLDGISLCKILRQEGYQGLILLLTAKDTTKDIAIGLDAGADDYLIKPFEEEELMARIRALWRRSNYSFASTIIWENLELNSNNNEVKCDGNLVHLTPKEYFLLELFLSHPHRIFSRRAILDRLWDSVDPPGEETVSTHIKSLRQKLKVVGVKDPIETVYGVGYRLREVKVPEIDNSDKLAYRQKLMEKLMLIWKRDCSKIAQRIIDLGKIIEVINFHNLTEELREQYEREVHNLAVFLGMFGLERVAELAKELEQILNDRKCLDAKYNDRIIWLVRAIQKEFDRSNQQLN